MFGGAAGSLKSETCLVDAIWRTADCPSATSIIFRRTFPELEELITRSRELYGPCGAYFNTTAKTWNFPSGMTVKFRQVERDADIHRFQGHKYDFIGWDESTHFPEFPIRYMSSRLRSTNPRLQESLRIRLYTNPGSRGHDWHKQIFMGKGCSHCKLGAIDGVLRPWKKYYEQRWPSDGRKIGFSTKFIPGRLSDHSLLGDRYAKQLEGLPAVYAKALKEGCWDIFVGQYFDCWNAERMVVKRQTIGDQWWWSYWVGVDYGFSGSAAAAYLFGKSPEGIMYVLDELVERRMKASDFAMLIKTRFHAGERKRVLAHYLSPDAWNDRTDAHTIADQMLDSSGIGFEKASNDRIGGASLLYTALDNGQLKIADTCENLIKSIPSRVHDVEKNPNDVLKVKESELDDCYDAARYGLYSYIGPSKKPRDVRLQEATEGIADPTAAMLRYKQEEAKLNKEDEPVTYRDMRPWRFGK